jgi:hypothetical protein
VSLTEPPLSNALRHDQGPDLVPCGPAKVADGVVLAKPPTALRASLYDLLLDVIEVEVEVCDIRFWVF